MCGRISTADLSSDLLKLEFQVVNAEQFSQGFNIAPTLQVPAVRQHNNKRYLSALRWGLVPHWSKDKDMKVLVFNARIETLSQKPFFRDPIKHKRSIIPASGFYEWQKQGDKKQPYYIYRADKQPLALAGLWDVWTDKASGETIESCAIVTIPATHQMEQIHDRMPAVLEREHYDAWLDPELTDAHALLDVLRSPSEDVLEMYPVSIYVSNARNDGDKCIERL